ncbi:hypothetical protein HR11_00295 [Porphyromonas macacae]|uniref:Uncharacterized protein n=1 Tax=Porphyromonas macacae TaxID=28115 RepID=A0A0A2E6F2_9PORP|nr:hypothetical protein [Porphyromonas macacae]KGN74488.1 hypothetical protein HQ47_05515 [Porphyromonas macacae]KGO00368.1 hypothetical protein HR11_00295 [Porphyromonas macacae]SUB77825.1 Uncharacterised protein [Porphyromonas macacae]SUB88954.1 Uncharacterised protein [Porphyromonas macacae]
MDRKELESLLTIIFYVLVVATLVTYFTWHRTYPAVFMTIGVTALVLRLLTYIIRYKKRK